jgi:TMEM175 potassium channel family protein
MSKSRLEAFSDGVIAILITIMVLDLRPPAGTDLHALLATAPTFGAYVLSFILLGTYWTNHHHMFQATDRINGAVLWANLHLLFWLSLVIFVTSWMGNHPADALPTAAYGTVMFLAGCAYNIVQATIIRAQGPDSLLKQAVGSDVKGKFSLVLFAASIPLAFVRPWIADAIYVVVVLMWLVPDPRIETQFRQAQVRE